jgi:hypothetical protein
MKINWKHIKRRWDILILGSLATGIIYMEFPSKEVLFCGGLLILLHYVLELTGFYEKKDTKI